MKSVLKRAEYSSKILKTLEIKNIKLTAIKIAEENPDTGHFRLKGYFNENEFIEIFQFYLKSVLLKYSYVYIMENKSILRFDNAPHHNELETFPDHKHIEEKVEELKDPSLKAFMAEIKEIRKEIQ